MSVVTEEMVADVAVVDSPEGLPAVDEATATKLTKNDEVIAMLVDLAKKTLDPADALRKYARLGKAVYDHAVWQKNQFPAWDSEDFDRLCDKVADQVKFQVPIKSVRMADYVKVYLWVQAVKPMVAEVEQLSYYVVVNKFLPTLSFSKKGLDAEIKKGWAEAVKRLVTLQVDPETKLSVKALDAEIEAHQAKLSAELNNKKTAEQLAEEARKKERADAAKKESKLRETIATSVDEALGGIMNPIEVLGIVEKIVTDRGMEMPRTENPIEAMANMSPAEAKALCKAMFNAGNIVAMKTMRDQLDAMVKVIENSMIESKTA